MILKGPFPAVKIRERLLQVFSFQKPESVYNARENATR